MPDTIQDILVIDRPRTDGSWASARYVRCGGRWYCTLAITEGRAEWSAASVARDFRAPGNFYRPVIGGGE